MCRMIAKASITETSIMDEMLNCPHSLQYLSTEGRLPDNPKHRGHHRDGCGVAFVVNNKIEIHKRGSKNAWNDSYIKIINQARSHLFLGHNRLASAGLESKVESSHPFEITAQGIPYGFSHNGTIYSLVDEAKQRGITDSELFFESLISSTENNSEEQILQRLKALIKEYTYNSITGFLLSPRKLMVWRVFNESDSTKQEDYNLYYTMYMKLSKGTVVFSSEPLDNEPWALLPNNSYVSVEPDTDKLKVNVGMLV